MPGSTTERSRGRPLDRRVGKGVLATLCAMTLLGAAPSPAEAPVADAAMRGDAQAVSELIEAGADVNAPQGDGMTALHWAAKSGDESMATVLLEAGADVGAVTRLGDYTPLHLAARVGSGSVVALLVEAGADAAARTSTGEVTPLHFAAASGSVEAVEALASAGAPVNGRESAQGQTPLIWAASLGRADATRALLDAGADPALTTRVVDIAARAVADRAERLERNARVRGGQPAEPWERSQKKRDVPVEKPSPEALKEQAEQEDAARMIEEPEPLSYGELVGGHGGLAALHHAAREGHAETVRALLESGANIDQPTLGDHTTPILMATVNGHFDLALELLSMGADPTVASDAGATPLYAAINVHWAPKSRYPQQHAYRQQEADYLDVMESLLAAGADPNVRLTKHLWYMSYNFDLLQVDTKGATPFWRAAYALDVDAMRMLVEHGADPNIPTEKVPERRYRRSQDTTDYSGLPAVPIGGPAVYPIHAASGVGYGFGYAANAHRYVPDGWLPAVRYLVEELGADVNQRDHMGYNALHHAASRGDNELIHYLVEQGADVTAVSRSGQTTADMANGPYQRTQPYPETVALLESLGSANNHNCVSC